MKLHFLKNLLLFFSVFFLHFPVSANDLIQSNQVFNWAEKNYPEYFSASNQTTFETSGYLARYYPQKNNYLGIKNGRVYVFGDIFGGLKDVGSLGFFLKLIQENTYINIRNTIWYYRDNDRGYRITFFASGLLYTQHPNDKTPDNDIWIQNNNEINFSFNDGFSNYKGTFSSNNIMSGTATNIKGKTWKWKATRIKK
ncbi:MAG: hypothetical protein KAG26_02410 [Methylococcales bacterium]|nr:hypothetical protein [Methylococcales bacterium]